MTIRDDFLDILKGLAIFLMVFGHCIQFGSGGGIRKSTTILE